jgi:RNA polymerase sigma-70 factor, ECF subfamily
MASSARPLAAGAGGELALARALREHGPSLIRTARRLCGNATDADDLVHDVYERALRSAERCVGHGNVGAYLHTILRNLFVDRRRRASRYPPPLPLEASDVGPWLPEPPAPVAAWADVTAEDLARALTELAEPFRVVFELHAFERLRYGDIAARLGIAPATVGTRLRRARSKLRRLLARAGTTSRAARGAARGAATPRPARPIATARMPEVAAVGQCAPARDLAQAA